MASTSSGSSTDANSSSTTSAASASVSASPSAPSGSMVSGLGSTTLPSAMGMMPSQQQHQQLTIHQQNIMRMAVRQQRPLMPQARPSGGGSTAARPGFNTQQNQAASGGNTTVTSLQQQQMAQRVASITQQKLGGSQQASAVRTPLYPQSQGVQYNQMQQQTTQQLRPQHTSMLNGGQSPAPSTQNSRVKQQPQQPQAQLQASHFPGSNLQAMTARASPNMMARMQPSQRPPMQQPQQQQPQPQPKMAPALGRPPATQSLNHQLQQQQWAKQQQMYQQQQQQQQHQMQYPKQFQSPAAAAAAVVGGAYRTSVPSPTAHRPPVPEPTNRILGKRSIQELVAQVDAREKIEPEVEDAMVEIAEEFVESVTAFACNLAKHRGSTVLEAKDLLVHLERAWQMTLPGFGGDDVRPYKKPAVNDIHKQRVAVVKKSLADKN